jgi:hypothetical protein
MRRPDGTSAEQALPSNDQSALERAIGLEQLERYEAALARLRPIDRGAIVARVKDGLHLRRDGRYARSPVRRRGAESCAARVRAARGGIRIKSYPLTLDGGSDW